MMYFHLNFEETGRHSLLIALIRKGQITYADNINLKIYGRLNCQPGKRMKTINRIFFANEAAAISANYRPCGHCMRQKYLEWKISVSKLPYRKEPIQPLRT